MFSRFGGRRPFVIILQKLVEDLPMLMEPASWVIAFLDIVRTVQLSPREALVAGMAEFWG